MAGSRKGWADLHIHSAKSDDGELSIDEIIKLVIKTRNTKTPIRMIAITDHEDFDFDGLAKGISFAKKNKIQLIPGLEVSTEDTIFGFDRVHILSFFPHHKPKDLKETKIYEIAREMQEEKRIRNEKYIRMFLSYELLKQEEVEDVDFGQSKATLVERLFGILQKKGRFKFDSKFYEIKEIQQVWDLVEDRRFKQERKKVSAESVIYETLALGGLPVVAHPLLIVYKATLESFMTRTVKEYREHETDRNKHELTASISFIIFLNYYQSKFPGLGVEVDYPYAKSREYRKTKKSIVKKAAKQFIKRIDRYCRNNDIVRTGGSDFHGLKRDANVKDVKKNIYIGDGKIELEYAKELLKIT